VALLVAGSLTAGFNAEHPRPNAVVYILNANTGQATWFSPNPDLDGWTEQFLSAEPEHGTLGDLFPLSFSETSMLTHEAPVVTMDAPQVEILDDQTAAGLRTLTLHLSSAQQAPVIMLGVQPRAAVHAVTIDGLRLDVPQTEDDLWRLTYYAVPAGGFNVALELDPSQPLTLQVSDNSRQLPEVSEMVAQPRSDDMIPMPNFDYWTVVVRAVEIP
jgi:hypothetical protein